MKTTPHSIEPAVTPRRHHLAVAALAAVLIAWVPPLHAAAYTWVGGSTSGSWGSSTNWSNNVTPTFDNTANLAFDTVARGTNFIATNRVVRSMSFGANIDSSFVVRYLGFPTGPQVAYSLTMAADTNDASINVDAGAAGNITLGTNSGDTSALGFLVLATNLNVVHNGTGLLLFNRGITNTNGSFGLTKSGAGTMQLNSFNTFSGPININGGRLIANTFGAAGQDLNAASAVNLNGAALQISASSGVSKTYSTVPFNFTNTSELIWNNTNTGNFSLTIDGANAFALNGNLTLQNASSNTANNNLMTISRSITGSGDLTNVGYNNIATNTNNYALGRLTLSGTNTNWNGNLVVARGTVNIGGTGSNAPAGTGTIFIGTTGDAFGAGLGTFFGTNVIPLNGNIYISNNFTIRSGGFRSLRPAGDHIMNFMGNITLEGNLNVDSALNFYTDKWINLLGNISGAGGLDVTRTSFGGHIELGGSNSYLGATTISSSATLQVNSPSGQAIPDTSAVTISGPIITNGAHVFTPALRLLTSETIGSLAASDPDPALVFSNGAVLTTGGDNASTTYAGSSTGAGGLTKSGTGTFTLAGSNAYTGNTVINNGQLVLATNGALTFFIGGTGTNNSVSGAGTALFRGTFNINLDVASTNNGDSWTLVSGGGKAYDGTFQVAGFTNSGGTWSVETNGVTYQFTQSDGILSVGSGTPPYDSWVSYWQGVDPAFTNTAGTADPDGDSFSNNKEFAFDGNPTVGSPALLTAVKSGTNAVFRYVARNSGATYSVKSTTNLAAGPWTNAPVTVTNAGDQTGINLPADYTRKEFTVPGSGNLFFQVEAAIAP